MGLSCSCDFDYEFDAGEWYYCYDECQYLIPLDTTKRKRCCSCNELINIGSLCNKYPRLRYPYDDIEARIKHGCDLDDSLCEEAKIPIANHYHCKICAEIWLNLVEIGYNCLSPNENMQNILKEYHKLSGFNKNKK